MDITEDTVETRTPLYGHTSPETAHVVDDYPYGFRLRCRIRYWLERHPRHGWRLCSQTTNPRAPGERWNAPRSSTYALVAGCMYLNGDGHVKWATISWSHSADAVARFVTAFPGAGQALDDVRVWALQKVAYLRRRADGHSGLAMKGMPLPMSEDEIAEARAELAAWTSVAEGLLSSHLADAHGQSDTSGMTLDDMRAAHKVAHDQAREADTF